MTTIPGVRPKIRAMSAYHVRDSTGLIKLDAMENPYPWPEGMEDDWLDHLRGVPLNRYPDASARRLKDSLRTRPVLGDAIAILQTGRASRRERAAISAAAGA